LRSEKEYTKMEAEKAALSLQSLESRNQDLLKQLSNANKSLISREDSIVVLKNENEQLKEEKNLLSTDQEAFREKIQKLFTEFDQIRGSYTALIAKVVAKFMDLKDYVPQNMAEKFDDTTAYSDERLRILNADYRDFLARKNQSYKNG